jgi:hypothetical protein
MKSKQDSHDVDVDRTANPSCEYEATVADIREGLKDYAIGRAESLSDAFADIRRQLAKLRVVH